MGIIPVFFTLPVTVQLVSLCPTYKFKPSLIICYRLAIQGVSVFLFFILTSCSSCISPSPVSAMPRAQPAFTSGVAAHHHKWRISGESEDWEYSHHCQPVEKGPGLANWIAWDSFVNFTSVEAGKRVEFGPLIYFYIQFKHTYLASSSETLEIGGGSARSEGHQILFHPTHKESSFSIFPGQG